MPRRLTLVFVSSVVLALALPLAARGAVLLFNTATEQTAAAPTEFFLAASAGDAERTLAFLRAGVPAASPVPQPAPADLPLAVGPRSHGALAMREGNATALMLAAAAGRCETMTALLAAGANREARTIRGTRPLDLAAMRGDVPAMQTLLGVRTDSLASRLAVVVDLATQRAIVSRDGVEVFTTKISSGRSEKPTPTGTFVITQKYPMWRSSLYQNAAMPFFLRLSCSAVGLHQGVLPGYPASHGCVRLPEASAKKLYAEVPVGTVVTIR